MSKKKSYSVFTHSISKTVKALSKNKTENAFWVVTQIGFDQLVKTGKQEPDVFAADCYGYFLWRYRKITHYFLDDGLADFLIGAVKHVTPSYCKALPDCDSVQVPSIEATWTKELLMKHDKGNTSWGGFAIHFPSKEQRRSIIVVPNMHLVKYGSRFSANPSCYKYYFAAIDGVDVILENTEQREKHPYTDKGQEEKVKIIMGLSLYIDAFPESVIQTKTDDLALSFGYKGKKITVQSNIHTEEDARMTPSPHWRRGHFRILDSERFTKKKGMSVYVRGTFVKGKAYNVMNDAEPIDAHNKPTP